MTANEFRNTADSFTKAYVEAAMWSSSAELGDCEKCDAKRVSTDPLTERHTCGGCVRGTDRSFQDLDFDIENIAETALDSIVADCKKFQKENGESITDEYCLKPAMDANGDGTLGRAGHDFWLNRNGHGCGFWDGDWAEPAATTLDSASKAFGEMNLYLGDDALIYSA